MSYIRSLFGAAEEQNPDESELVDKFVERLETASTLADRRNALKGLRHCAKNARISVATNGLHLYLEILDKEPENDLVSMTLEIFNSVLGDDEENLDEDICDRLAQTIVKKPVFMPAMLRILENNDFGVRKNAIQLLTTLLRYRAGEVQEAIVRDPTGTSKIVDLLLETREVIRNHVVLMLSELSRGNSSLQQLLVFQNCFQLLFDIIEQEPTDSIVVEDCLFVTLNLLKKNSNNQAMFREASMINRLLNLTNNFLYPSDELDETESDWLPQKTANFIFILQVIRTLVSPTDNTHNNTHAAQNIILKTNLIQLLIKTMLSEFLLSVDVLSETAITVADVVRGNYANQKYLSSSTISHPDSPGELKSALFVLLNSMTSEKQLFRLRCSVFYCFLCYLYGNDTGKQRIITSLLGTESSEENTDSMIGQHLITAIVSAEPVQVWFGAVCLMYTLFDADDLKPQLLRVQLSIVRGEEPSSLLSHVGNLLVSLGARRLQTRCGLLMLLGVWMFNCGQAVEEFTAEDTYLEYLTAHLVESNTELKEGEDHVLKGLIAFVLGLCVHHFDATDNTEKKNHLMSLIDRRGGSEQVAEALDSFLRTEYYIRAAQKPLPSGSSCQELLLEYQFTKLFKNVEGTLMKIFRPNGDFQTNTGNSDAIVASYKKLIKQQDDEIASLKQQLDQLKLAQVNGTAKTDEQDEPKNSAARAGEIQNLKQELEYVKGALAAKQEECVQLAVQASTAEQMTTIARQWQAEADRFKAFAEQWQSYQLSQMTNTQDTAVQQLLSQTTTMEQQLRYGWECFEGQSKQQTQLVEELERTKNEVQRIGTQLAEANKQLETSTFRELNTTRNELEAIKKENQEVLLMMADQDTKMATYRRRLRQFGDQVSDDEDDHTAPPPAPLPPPQNFGHSHQAQV